MLNPFAGTELPFFIMGWIPAAIAAGAALYGGYVSNKNARSQQSQNTALQREFAQNSIQWKTADAKAAGLHPLYAMGSAATPYSPTTYSDSMGPALASAGQSVARGYAANQAQKNTDRQYNKSVSDSNFMRRMQQDRMILEQQKLKAEINYTDMMSASIAARARQAGNSQQDLTVDGLSSDLAQDKGQTQVVPKELTPNKPGSPSIEAGENPLWVIEKAGRKFKSVRLNDEAAEAYGDLAAPIINAAATAWYYTFNTLPDTGKHNIKVLLQWYEMMQGKPIRKKPGPKSPKIKRIERFGLPKPRPLR